MDNIEEKIVLFALFLISICMIVSVINCKDEKDPDGGKETTKKGRILASLK